MVELNTLEVAGLIGGGFAMGAIWMAMLVGVLAMKGNGGNLTAKNAESTKKASLGFVPGVIKNGQWVTWNREPKSWGRE